MHREQDENQDEDQEETDDWPEGAIPSPGPTSLDAEAGFPQEFDREAFWVYLCKRFGHDIVADYTIQPGLPENERKIARHIISNIPEGTAPGLITDKGLDTRTDLGLTRNIPAPPVPMPLNIGVENEGPLSKAPQAPRPHNRSEDLPLQIIADLRNRSWKKRQGLQ